MSRSQAWQADERPGAGQVAGISNPAFAAMVPVVSIFTGMLVLWSLVHVPPMMCVNDMSRWDTVWSLVHRGTYAIGTDAEPEPWGTIDKIKRDGAYYSSKPPLYPTVLAGEYWLLRKVTGWDMREQTEAVCRTLLITFNVIPLVGFVWLYGLFLGRHVRDPWARSFWLVGGALGTYVTGYSVTLNNHSVSAWATMYALYFTARILYDGDRRRVMFFLVGLSAAWASANEVPGILLLVGVLAILGWRAGPRTWAYALPPALVILAAEVYTNSLAFGTIVPVYFLKDTELYHYPGSYWNSPQGIDAQHEPKLVYALYSSFGHHGIFSLTPILCFAAVSWVLFLCGKNRQVPELQWLAMLISVGVYAAYVLHSEQNYGGGCKGFRWMFWTIPLYLISAPLGAEHYSRSRLVRALAYVALGISLWTVFDALGGPWGSSWLHVIYSDLGIINY